jgi:eukaryotic-like serine/threonine-protein kinase
MTPERWQEVKNLLAAALEGPPQDRTAYLDRACSEPAIRREVESLLAAHDQGDGSFLERLATANGEPLKVGDRIGPYEILARIGAGGMGIVYRARDSRLEREVAVKILSAGLLTDENARRRFRKEALALAKLNHPNIAAVHDVGEQEGIDYLVLECVPGLSLAEKMKSGPLAEKEISSVGAQIAAALEEAHEQGIIHRDLKPANVMVTPKGQAKVLDFGLAKLLPFADVATTQSFAESQAIVGTLPYMAPEQLQGEPVDARTDIHALGLVLFEMASGRRLFQRDSIPQLTDAILHQLPVTPRAFNARVSTELERIILKCLEKQPENRYQSAKELGVDLRHIAAPHTTTSAAAIATAPPRARRARRGLLAGAAVLVAAASVAAYFYFHRVPKFTEEDSILLAGFANSTGDPVFDGTLRQGLSVQLQQTPYLQLVSDQRVGQTLQLMEKPPGTKLTPAVAREVCQRANATTDIEGSIATLGNQYVLGLNAVTCSTGKTLAAEQVTADGKEKVLPALTTAASDLRSKLGESRASLDKHDVPLDQATTSSLEALQAFTLGSQAFWNSDMPTAASQYERAVSLDPNFAMAHTLLGVVEGLLGDGAAAEKDLKEAYGLRDRTSEFEKFGIEADYHYGVTQNFDKMAQVGKAWAQAYPRNPLPLSNLNDSYSALGRVDDALTAELGAFRIDSSGEGALLAWAYVHGNRFGEASATIQQARARHLDNPDLSQASYVIAFLQNDATAMAAQVSASPSWYPAGTGDLIQSETAAYDGHIARARELAQRAIAYASQQRALQLARDYEAVLAVQEALLGNFEKAREVPTRGTGAALSLDAQGNAALALALAGNAAEAQKLADDLNQRFPEATIAQFVYLPATRAALAIHRGNPQKAIETLRVASGYELATSPVLGSATPALITVYIRGQAYLAAGQGDHAGAEFQKILDHPGVVQNSPVGALAHLGLGRAYALQVDTTKARAAYQDFLTLWKEADPDIPIFKQAKAEYAKLR